MFLSNTTVAPVTFQLINRLWYMTNNFQVPRSQIDISLVRFPQLNQMSYIIHVQRIENYFFNSHS